MFISNGLGGETAMNFFFRPFFLFFNFQDGVFEIEIFAICWRWRAALYSPTTALCVAFQ